MLSIFFKLIKSDTANGFEISHYFQIRSITVSIVSIILWENNKMPTSR